MGGRETVGSAADNRKRVSVYAQYFVRLLISFRDRNWLEFLAILDATFSMEGNATQYVEEARTFFAEVAERDGRKDRSGPLALLELEKRAKDRSIYKGAYKTLHNF